MRQLFIKRSIASACIYWIYFVLTLALFVYPVEFINLGIFIPPILGILWGLPAAIGVSVGGCLTVTFFFESFGGSINDILHLLLFATYLFIAAYLPYFLWNKWKPKRSLFLSTEALKKLIAVLFVTFVVTTLFRTLTVYDFDLDAVTGLFGFEKKYTILIYAVSCFLNDFLIAILFDLVLFFVLAGRNYNFYSPGMSAAEVETELVDPLTDEEHKALRIAAVCYLIFPAAIAYWDVYQIYGMDRIETWVNFIVECLTIMDIYIVLIIYMLLKYRRSIMMELVFFVALTVLLSSAVLGWGSSVAMGDMVKSHADDSLHAMSVICRERLERTFFCVRQAVRGMERQAEMSIESYQKFVEDAEYRKDYLNEMKKDFDAIAMDTDGCLAYYMRLSPEIEGNKGGFSRERESSRWEGALAKFAERTPVDLSLYSADDYKNVGWYYTPLKSKTATWIEPYIDPTTRVYVISYVAPIFIEGKAVGVIGMDIDFNFIIQELRRMSIYDYGYVYIMNRNNSILYHRDQVQGTQFKPNPEYQEIERYLANGMWLGIATPLSKVHDERNHIIMHLIAAIIFVAMLVSIGSILLVSRAIQPLKGMTDAAKRIASGDLNVKISYDSGNELGILVRSIREMATKLEIYVYRDKLTGLRNPAAYISKSEELDRQSKVISDLNYAVILFDVNFLKKINDNHGHQAGDILIRHAARAICRVFDHSPIYRIGGDEFVAILEGEDYENREKLIQLFDEKIVQESFEIAEETVNISVARGMAIYKNGMSFSEVAKTADGEMYTHKAAIKAKFGEDVR